ncbi:SDR family NAD(P)-dependent oxidoreductase [Pseudooceanicola spongiae]|uniref:SDR family oxidoreductase n=1 Tax=Pseudooceanicola spongiae TaxID=2613965 RepID=A0A7L9WIN8_9RHOB|nr:SDR family oxidoreductase [Pseudooceanicola spongiae]QOL79684.1 SDR family oxidoreductase [Pseudooceanicola spongiae]
MARLQGKVAVITGGSSGIGLATAHRFVAEGAHVFITGRRAETLEAARLAIGRNVSTVNGDVASLADLDRLYAQVSAEKGVIDILVANAGYVEPQPLEDATPDHFDMTFGVNARGVFFTVQKALPLMSRGGAVVLIASNLHLKGYAAHSTYAASKAAVRSFARSWANELLDRNIRVNTLSPGSIDTPITKDRFETQDEADEALGHVERLTPLGRIGRAEEMASAILFLASDESSYSTGIDLVADGGITQL